MALVTLAGCAEPPAPPPPVGGGAVPSIRELKVFFAHQSVGDNLLEGVRTVDSSLGIDERTDAAGFEKASLLHTHVGENGKPLGKLEHFEKLMNDGLGDAADVAMVKLCYVDFDAGTDVEQLFSAYQAMRSRLTAKFPRVAFVVVTAPLSTVQTGAKAWLKNTFGSGAYGAAENAKRHAFNQKLREAYGSSGQLFDLAAIESRQTTFERDGQQIPALDPALTDDGGHLNASGRTVVARRWLEFLAKVPRAR